MDDNLPPVLMSTELKAHYSLRIAEWPFFAFVNINHVRIFKGQLLLIV